MVPNASVPWNVDSCAWSVLDGRAELCLSSSILSLCCSSLVFQRKQAQSFKKKITGLRRKSISHSYRSIMSHCCKAKQNMLVPPKQNVLALQRFSDSTCPVGSGVLNCTRDNVWLHNRNALPSWEHNISVAQTHKMILFASI